jgi:hypothetical protein
LTARYRFGSWCLAVVLFAFFTLATYGQLQAGKTDCGCFGVVKVPPRATLVLDIVMLVLLLRGRPTWTGWPEMNPEFRFVAIFAGVTLFVLLTASAIAYVRFGSIQAAVATAAGLPVTLVEPIVNVGTVAPDELVQGELEIRNLSEDEMQVTYITTRCRCAEFHDLPKSAAPSTSVRVGLTMRTPSTPGLFRRPGEVRTSVGVTTFELVGYVSASR